LKASSLVIDFLTIVDLKDWQKALEKHEKVKVQKDLS
jgi:hypothetical protein